MEVKVPFYNILNMFLTGLVFIGGCLIIFPDTAVAIFNSDIIKSLGAGPEIVITVCTFAVAYEVGLIINRTGSVILEPLLKRAKLIPFNNRINIKAVDNKHGLRMYGSGLSDRLNGKDNTVKVPRDAMKAL